MPNQEKLKKLIASSSVFIVIITTVFFISVIVLYIQITGSQTTNPDIDKTNTQKNLQTSQPDSIPDFGDPNNPNNIKNQEALPDSTSYFNGENVVRVERPEFKEIEIGMTRIEIENILGDAGDKELESRDANATNTTYTYNGGNKYQDILINYQNDIATQIDSQ